VKALFSSRDGPFSVRYDRFKRIAVKDVFDFGSFLQCFSGRELFAADASLFVDDAEAFDEYQREEEEQEEPRSSGQAQNAQVQQLRAVSTG
jgi:hypothetical protein